MPPIPSVIAGRVVDAAGHGVPDARVFLVEGPVPLPEVAALTDEHGAFELSVPALGTYVLRAVADAPPTTVAQSLTVTVDARGARRALDVRLSPRR